MYNKGPYQIAQRRWLIWICTGKTHFSWRGLVMTICLVRVVYIFIFLSFYDYFYKCEFVLLYIMLSSIIWALPSEKVSSNMRTNA